MAIKQLEDNDNSFYLKAGMLFFLLAAAFIIGIRKYHWPQNNKKQVLGKEFNFARKKNIGEKEIAEIKKKGDKLVKETREKGEKIAGQILGETARVVNQTASKSAQTVNDFIFQNTIKKLVDQIDRLPQSQKKRVIENLCNQN